MILNCIALDDEPLALSQITGYIQKVPFLNLVASCPDSYSAMEALTKNNVDLLFVDINIPDLNGLDFVRSITTNHMIIFTTAYSEYAVEGFKVNATDYLLKPFGFEEFLKAANKALVAWELKHQTTPAGGKYDEYIFVKSDYKFVKVKIADIIYIESRNEYIRIYPVSGTPILTLLSLKSIEEKLPPALFMRIHRSYIINLTMISEYSKAGVTINPVTFIPIGDQYREKFNNYISKHSVTK
jgi:two-component system LytT family response regulator